MSFNSSNPTSTCDPLRRGFALALITLLLWSAPLWTAAARAESESPFLVVLGVAQDAGYPQAGCRKACCRQAREQPARRRYATSFGIVDPAKKQRWIVECTPHFPAQLEMLDKIAPAETVPGLDGILLTHAHIGHYTGLIHLGREVIGARSTPVYAMPRMSQFLRNNGPWGQLVRLEQIVLKPLRQQEATVLNERIRVKPMLVPHRDEYSETVGFVVEGPRRKALLLPDIDKWERWDTRIESVLQSVDVAYVDGTFFANGELPGRDMSKIPHPFISESMRRFATLPKSERAKVRFIHFNHTNPALRADSNATLQIQAQQLRVARQEERFGL